MVWPLHHDVPHPSIKSNIAIIATMISTRVIPIGAVLAEHDFESGWDRSFKSLTTISSPALVRADEVIE
jgi:hypothetical protein